MPPLPLPALAAVTGLVCPQSHLRPGTGSCGDTEPSVAHHQILRCDPGASALGGVKPPFSRLKHNLVSSSLPDVTVSILGH